MTSAEGAGGGLVGSGGGLVGSGARGEADFFGDEGGLRVDLVGAACFAGARGAFEACFGLVAALLIRSFQKYL